MPRLPAGFGTTAVLIAALLLVAAPAHAQYFGRNKVQYERFDFRVLQTEHFDVHYYPSERVAAEAAARMAERWYTRLSRILRHELSGRQPLVLYATAPQFQQTNIVGQIGEGTGGVTEALRRRIVMPIGGTLADLDHVLGHELVHAFQYDITGTGSPNTLGAIPAASALPLWFIEGMAEYLSVGPVSPFTAMWMRGGLEDTLPSFRQLEDPRFFPYRYGHALLAYVAGQWGDAIMGDLLRSAARARNIERGIQAVLVVTPEELVARWHAATYAAYRPLVPATRARDGLGTRIIAAGGRNEGGAYNVAPAVSPDGERLMFLSDRELFSIDLFLADGRTGEVRRQITRTALDPHLQSLQFIQSAGSWDPTGRRFVYAGIAAGRPLLRIYDVERGKSARDIPLTALGEIFNPSWSPDGGSIVFSGVAGGLTDLYVYDLEADRLRRLTNDRYADLQPAWSPDGRSIVFASDRFTTDLGTLRIGRYALALLDVASARVRQVPGFTGVRHLNPQWAPDGRSIYFLADPLGITNVYRLELESGGLSQVTDVFTGISGITETSPALSVAQGSGRVVFSLFGTDGYEIYGIEGTEALAAAARQARERGEVPVVFSGNCHACLGAIAGTGPGAIVWFDAHGDLNTPETTETGYFDGMALATALGWSWTNLARQIPGFASVEERDVLLVGGRDLDRLERVRLRRSNVRHYLPPPLADGADAAFSAAITAGLTKRAYIHIDLDVIDPSELWANQFKVPGGVSVAWLEAALREVRKHYEIAGVAVTAYDPAFTAPATASPIVNRLLKALVG